MATGFSFVDNSELSVREKIDRYFLSKNNAKAVAMPVLDESTSDDSAANSICGLDDSFAQILNNNTHVTLIRNSRKQISPRSEQSEEMSDESIEEKSPEHRRKPERTPYMPTPTRRGEVRCPIKSDDSIELSPYDMWYVSDESFLEMEKACESPRDNENGLQEEANDRTLMDDFQLLNDEQPPSFMIQNSDSEDQLDDSVFERPSHSIFSPMQLVAMRRPSTILEESTIGSINSSKERSSLSLKHSIHVAKDSNQSVKSYSFRPSLTNVFPPRSRIGFYDKLDSSLSAKEPSVKDPTHGKENSMHLMRFDSIDKESPPPSLRSATEVKRNDSIYLMRFESIDKASSNLAVDQTQDNSSFDCEPPDQFNDTLEAVDFMIMQGNKIKDKTSTGGDLLQPYVVSSPKNRNDSLLKQTLARRHLMSMNGDSNFANKKLF